MTLDVDEILKLLEKEPQIARTLYEILRDRFVTREESQRLLEEIQKSREESTRRFDEQQAAIQEVQRAIQEQQRAIQELTVSIMRIEQKEGEILENTVLNLMKETLVLQNIDPSKVRREVLTDPKGEVFYQGYQTDIDVLLENDNTYLVEVKATTSSQEIAHFLQNVRLYELRNLKKVTRPILVTLRITQSTYALAKNQQIKVITGGYLD